MVIYISNDWKIITNNSVFNNSVVGYILMHNTYNCKGVSVYYSIGLSKFTNYKLSEKHHVRLKNNHRWCDCNIPEKDLNVFKMYCLKDKLKMG